MSTVCTFPGRFGDLLWALPTVRAISQQQGQPVDLVIAGEFAGIVPLLQLQPYLKSVQVLPEWTLTPPEEWKAPIPEALLRALDVDEIRDLGYRGWPAIPLPFAIAQQAQVGINLTVPWITVQQSAPPTEIAVGFTEAWFELKLGLVHAALETMVPEIPYLQLTPPHSRWCVEARGIARHATADWIEIAGVIRNSDLFWGDCSALHVLAVALGKPVVLVEPMEARWNPIFYPLGMDGPQVTVVKGLDGRPTFDARHATETLRKEMARVR